MNQIDHLNDQDSKDVELKEVFFILFRNSKIIFISIFTSIILVILYSSLLTKSYTSTSSVLIEQEQTDISSIFALGDRSETNFLLNEIEILKSRNIRHKTIEKLYRNHYNDLILFGTKRPEYTWLGSVARNIWVNLKNNGETYELDTFEKFIKTPIYTISMDHLNSNIFIANPRKTDIINVSYRSKSPTEAALILDTLINTYQEADQQWAAGELIYLDNFLTNQIKEKEIRLAEAEDKLMEYQKNNNIFSNSDLNNLLITELTEIESDYYKTIAEKNIETKRKEFYLNQLDEDEKELANKITNTLNIKLSSMRTNLSKLETELVSAKATKGANHPAVSEIELKISKLKKDLEKDTKNYINEGISSSNPLLFRQTVMDTIISISAKEEVLLAKEKELSILSNEYSEKIKTLPAQILSLSRLQRDKSILDETYKVMKTTLEETRISKAAELGRVRIIDKSSLPIYPSSLGFKNYILLGFFLGFGVSVIFIGLREYLDNTVKSIEELERRNLPILSIIPEFVTDPKNRYIALLDDPKSIVSEAYRNLRTSLMMDNIDNIQSAQTILVCSPGPKEGKSTISTNLALSYVQAGKKVIYVDADLRKPVVHKIFNAKKYGITNYFNNPKKEDYKKYIQKSADSDLSLFCSGPVPPNPSEILSSKRMAYLVETLKKEYDIIIFDSPPFIAVTDSYIISKYVDKTVLVVRSNVTLKAVLQRTLTSLNQQDSNISGVAFNGIKAGTGYYGGYYYNYYSYYYGEESEAAK